jgi:hypothetical protein
VSVQEKHQIIVSRGIFIISTALPAAVLRDSSVDAKDAVVHNGADRQQCEGAVEGVPDGDPSEIPEGPAATRLEAAIDGEPP